MLSKNCRKILRKLNQITEPASGLAPNSIAKLAQLTEVDCRRAIDHLTQENYLKIVDYSSIPGRSRTYSDSLYILTENGACYRAIMRRAFWSYIADKWIDIFASLFSLAALIISIVTATRSAG